MNDRKSARQQRREAELKEREKKVHQGARPVWVDDFAAIERDWWEIMKAEYEWQNRASTVGK